MTPETLAHRRTLVLRDLEHAQAAAARAATSRAFHRHTRRIRNAMATLDGLAYLARTFCGAADADVTRESRVTGCDIWGVSRVTACDSRAFAQIGGR